MKKIKRNWKSISVALFCLIAILSLSVPAFAAGSSKSVTLNVNDRIAISDRTGQSTNSAHITGKVYAESKHGVVYHARSLKNALGYWFDRETRHYDDLTYDQNVNFTANPLGNDCWRLEIEPNGPLFTNCHADGTIDNR